MIRSDEDRFIDAVENLRYLRDILDELYRLRLVVADMADTLSVLKKMEDQNVV